MLKLSSSIVYTIVLLVIYSRSILKVECNDSDEFAEFDDFPPGEISSQQSNKPIRDERIDENLKLSIEESNKKTDLDLDDNLKVDETQNKKPDLQLVNAPSPIVYNWESYYVEIGFLIAITLYIINYFLGSSKNTTFAYNYYDNSKDIMKQQFSLVGGSPQLTATNSNGQKQKEEEDHELAANLKKQKGLIKTSESMYTMWMSGRVGMDGLLVEINLLKRQDLFSMALYLLKPSKDTVTFRFLLNQEGYENFVFCLAQKAYAPKLARDMIDINTFCPKRKPITQCGVNSEKLFIMSELSDVVPLILDQRTGEFLKKYEQTINYIHITDQYSTIRSEDVPPAQRLASSKRMATFQFVLPTTDSERNDYITFSLSLLDRLRRIRLARDSKQKSEKNRQKITDIIEKTKFSQRQEAAQAKKEELRRLEKERIYNEDDPEKQKRWEKKEAKRELKKNKMRVKQLKVKSM